MNMKPKQPTNPSLFGILKPYRSLMIGLILLGFATNGLNLLLPKIIARGIDTYTQTNTILWVLVWEFALISFGTFIFAYFQSIAQTYASEKIARNLREQIISKIAEQSYSYVAKLGSGKLLTNLTSDIDNIKQFAGQAVVTLISSLFLVIGAAILMLMIDWRLATAVLATLPLITIVFAVVFKILGPVFKKSQEVIDWLNKIINESILGAAVVRVLDSKNTENTKFAEANGKSAQIGIQIAHVFAFTFPSIGFIAGLSTLVILILGGHFIIVGSMTIGTFTAFVSYLGIIIFPLIMIGFLMNSITRAAASYGRVSETLNAHVEKTTGTVVANLTGDIEIRDVSIVIGEKTILKDISFKIKGGSRTAILGPTAAGKTHLLYLLTGILPPTSGQVLYDGRPITEYETESLHQHIGIVFQDSIMFNMSLRENIAFNTSVTDASLKKALDTAELSEFVDTLPGRLDAMVMERGTSLSGGQKQRIMLARALALNPKILLLDDFTARVDSATETKILANVRANYPDITLISVTQKINSVEDFDQIILLMEGELLAKGTHEELMNTSPEYVQIYDSQRSTTQHEL
ncbi:MAG: hypothetical protein RIT04_346 [Candidatus Parcubacteria bacterium]|jgi:ATP-binding cassette subfamily B protein